MSSSCDVRAPFLLSPAGKDYLWGGSRLKDHYQKEIDLDPLAETWECSTHPDGPSVAASGAWKGMLLEEVLRQHPEFLGTNSIFPDTLPILVKLIDAQKDLSVQVHPDDAYAAAHENGSLGKMEMWYVLEASPDARLVYGFKHDMRKETVERSIADGTIEKYLCSVLVKKDDIFFIPAGRVHAIGAGIVVAEVQESSNITYRLYDYDRVDASGNKRPLHVKKAMEVAELKGNSRPRQPMRVFRFQKGYLSELVCRCRYFQVERLALNTETFRELADFETESTSFQVLLCTDGCGVLFWEGGQLNVHKGDCIFVPADSVKIKLHGVAQFLKISC